VDGVFTFSNSYVQQLKMLFRTRRILLPKKQNKIAIFFTLHREEVCIIVFM